MFFIKESKMGLPGVDHTSQNLRPEMTHGQKKVLSLSSQPLKSSPLFYSCCQVFE